MNDIVQDGNEVLRHIAKEVPASLFGSKELSDIVERMKASVDTEPDGVALAAPQLGISYRIFIVRYDRIAPPKEHEVADVGVFINPVLLKTSKKQEEVEEGCLSVRGKYGKAKRFTRATVRAYDETGKVFERGGGGVLAQAFQHEIDHLNGVLFIDHATHVRTVPLRQEVLHKPFVFFGTPNVASHTLSYLYKEGYTPALVVTAPPAPRGRGLTLSKSETHLLAEKISVPVITPETITSEVVEMIRAQGASYGVCVAYGKILPESLIQVFPLGILNIHYSLLPTYRGASPVEAALLNEETETGVTIQKMVKELDAGDIVAQLVIPIKESDTTRELRARLIAIGAELLAEVLPYFEEERITMTPQNHALATKCGKIKKEDGELLLSGNAQENWNKYRAYAESPGTYFFVEKNGKRIRVKIKTATYTNGTFTPLRIVPEGKKEMNYSDFSKSL